MFNMRVQHTYVEVYLCTLMRQGFFFILFSYKDIFVWVCSVVLLKYTFVLAVDFLNIHNLDMYR